MTTEKKNGMAALNKWMCGLIGATILTIGGFFFSHTLLPTHPVMAEKADKFEAKLEGIDTKVDKLGSQQIRNGVLLEGIADDVKEIKDGR